MTSSGIHLNSNVAARMSSDTIREMVSWCNRTSADVDTMCKKFKDDIAVECSFELTGRNGFDIIFTSGAAESNSHIITSAVQSYTNKTRGIPHIIISAVESESIQLCAAQLRRERRCQLTVIPVCDDGAISPTTLHESVRTNTCLISICAANGETGIINNIRTLSQSPRLSHIPFHTDASQMFGRSAVRPAALGVDAFTAEFQHIGGPPGVGILVVRSSVVEGYNLSPIISGVGDSLRGGALNIPALGAAAYAFRVAMIDRSRKITHTTKLRNGLWNILGKHVTCFMVRELGTPAIPSIDGGITEMKNSTPATDDVQRAIDSNSPALFWVAPTNTSCVLPNTMLLGMAVNAKNIVDSLAHENIYISKIGGRIINAANIHPLLNRGLILISLSDDTTVQDIKIFAKRFLKLVAGEA